MVEQPAEPGLLAGFALVPEASERRRLGRVGDLRQVIEDPVQDRVVALPPSDRRKAVRPPSPSVWPRCYEPCRALGGKVPSSASTALAAAEVGRGQRAAEREPQTAGHRYPALLKAGQGPVPEAKTISRSRGSPRHSDKGHQVGGYCIEVASSEADHHASCPVQASPMSDKTLGTMSTKDRGSVSTRSTTDAAHGLVSLGPMSRAPNRGGEQRGLLRTWAPPRRDDQRGLGRRRPRRH